MNRIQSQQKSTHSNKKNANVAFLAIEKKIMKKKLNVQKNYFFHNA